MTTMSNRFGAAEMLKAAMDGVASRHRVGAVASQSIGGETKQASAESNGSVSTTHAMKLASARREIAGAKHAEAMQTSETDLSGTPGSQINLGAAHHKTVQTPGTDGKLKTTETDTHGKTPQKIASILRARQAELKTASDIDAGPSLPSGNSDPKKIETGTPGPSVKGSDQLIASNEAARNFTKGQAKAQNKADVKQYVQEPAMSAKTDPVLSQALTHNQGSKIASAESVKLASGRALLNKIAADLEEKDKKKSGMKSDDC